VVAKCEVYENEADAIFALLAFKPQLICVKSKHEMMELAKNDCIKRQYQIILLHYRELPEDDKERAFSALHSDTGTTLVIATSGITTGRRILGVAHMSNAAHTFNTISQARIHKHYLGR
jgi:hypothetical protein